MVHPFSDAAILLAKSAAQDPVRRSALGQGSTIPATTIALQCLIPSLATRWRHTKHVKDDFPRLEIKEESTETALPVINDCSGKTNPKFESHGIISRIESRMMALPGWEEEEIVQGCQSACRLLRNLCPSNAEAQSRIRKDGALSLMLILVQVCCSWHESPTDYDAAKANTLLLSALQVCPSLKNAHIEKRRLR
jgi:hypothetical protein